MNKARGNSFDSEMIAKIYKLYKLKCNTLEAKELLDIDPTTASRYYRAFRQMEHGEDVNISKINNYQFKKFVTENGFKCKYAMDVTQEEESVSITTPVESMIPDNILEEINKTLVSMRNIFNYMLKYMSIMSEAWGCNPPEINGGEE